MNRLYHGGNLAVLREQIADAGGDLIRPDPPFNSNASCNVLFRAPTGGQRAAGKRDGTLAAVRPREPIEP